MIEILAQDRKSLPYELSLSLQEISHFTQKVALKTLKRKPQKRPPHLWHRVLIHHVPTALSTYWYKTRPNSKKPTALFTYTRAEFNNLKRNLKDCNIKWLIRLSLVSLHNRFNCFWMNTKTITLRWEALSRVKIVS